MKWRKVDRARRVQPKTGDYGDWKDQIADECGNRCVYCGLSEGRGGGRRNYHVDHFRPKSLQRFANLRKVIQNLYLACSVCNCFKSNHWPNDPRNDHSVEAFIDPAEHDYNELFVISPMSYEASSTYVAGAFVIEQLFLNRPHLLAERRLVFVINELGKRQDALDLVIQKLFDSESDVAREMLKEVLATAKEIRNTERALAEAVPYRSEDQKRN